MPFPAAGPMPMMDPGMFPPAPGFAPAVGGAGFMPIHFEDESSSSFMPMMHPGAPVAAPVAPTGLPIQPAYMPQGAGFGGQVPQGYQAAP